MHKNLQDISDGIVGIRNTSYYCYLNALMQCMVPITELRDHYLTQEYSKYKAIETIKSDF